MNINEELWSQFLLKVTSLFQPNSVDEILLLEKGQGPWDSLKNIQLFVVLREILGEEIDATQFLEAKFFIDFKVFFKKIS